MRHVALDLRVDWTGRAVEGTAALTLVPRASLDTIALDAAWLDIKSVTMAGGTALTFVDDKSDRDGALRVALPRSAAPGTPLTLQISYRTTWVNHADPANLGGSNGKGLRFFSPTTTEPIKRRQLWSIGEPTGNRYWYPGHDTPDDLITSEVRVTVAAPLTVVSNGRLVGTRPNADGTRTWHWRQNRPHANHLTTLTIGEYRTITHVASGVTLQSVGYPDEYEAVKASVVRLPRMMEFFTRQTGVPFPGQTYSQVFVQDLPWGIRGSGASTLTENMIDDYRTHEDWRYLWDGLEAEALASQWFGGVVSIREWRHAWLSRAFAHYFDALFSEYINGRDEALLWNLTGDRNAYLADWNSGTRQATVPQAVDSGGIWAASTAPYNRGALVLHMLRKEVGDSAWWRGIRRFLRRHAGSTVTTEDFQRAMEDASGRPLGWFFDQWVYGIGHPVFEVTTEYDGEHKTLTLKVLQTQTRDSTWEPTSRAYFEGAMEIAIDNRVERIRLAPRRENVFTYRTNAPPRLVAFDRGGTWIKEVRFTKPVSAWVHQSRADVDATGRQNAVRELAAIARDTAATTTDRQEATKGLHQVIRHDGFWRVRYSALLQLQSLVTPANPATPAPLDTETRDLLLHVIKTERSWVRSAAFSTLGLTRDPAHAELYIAALADSSHPVNYTAAIALGKSGSPAAFEALTAYMKLPSWKGENVICAMAGLKELGDKRGAAIALAVFSDTTTSRWFLATSRWDFRMAAAEVLVALGAGEQAWPTLERRYRRSLEEGDTNDIFSNVLLMAILGDRRAAPIFGELRERYKSDAGALSALSGYEAQWKEGQAVMSHR